MAAGAAWSFGFERRDHVGNETEGGWVYQRVKANVSVLGLENVTTALGTFEAFHLHAHIEAMINTTASWEDLDYWYAPQARYIVKLVAVGAGDYRDTSELVAMREA
jgi:hypothetical protein